VVGHQHVRMHQTAVAQRSLAQPREIGAIVRILEETRLPVVTALHDVLGNTGKIRARLAWHGSLPKTPACRASPSASVSHRPSARQEGALTPLVPRSIEPLFLALSADAPHPCIF
jgi:hypothetical protein